MFKGQPVPTTTYQRPLIKQGEADALMVTVPENTTVNYGEIVRFDGFMGFALDDVVTGAGETKELQIETSRGRFPTDQIDPDGTFAKGTMTYWDATNKRLTDVEPVENPIPFLPVYESKDVNNVIVVVRY